jgi:uncharacterized membrane protein YphA (DoxX/SURF4 family)
MSEVQKPESPARFGKQRILDAAKILTRWILGALFLYLGLKKTMHPEAFLKLVRQYDMVSNPMLLNAIAAGLPWFETFCGLLLLTGVAVRGAALMLLAMLIPFTLLILKRALAVASAQALAFCAVKFDCGCGMGEVLICHKLVENCVLMLLAGWLLTGGGRQFCARFTVFKRA